MKEILKDIKAGLPWYVYLAGGICLIVFVVGFFMPPIGEIDGSVLKGIGELLGGTWGSRTFYGCTNLGWGDAGYAFSGTSQDFAACVLYDDLTSGCEDYGYQTTKPKAANGECFAFTESTDPSGVSLTYIQ